MHNYFFTIEDSYLHLFGRLFHQYITDMYSKIELSRLNYIRFNQAALRSERYKGKFICD